MTGEHDNRSTSGGFLALVGPSTYFPLSAFSKKQTSTALSSTEAEVVCANVSLRSLGLPSSALWSILLNAGGGTKQQHASLTKGKPSTYPRSLMLRYPESKLQGIITCLTADESRFTRVYQMYPSPLTLLAIL